ncbi:hypothetical protein [Enterovirga rhinocerotis]|uniref:Uncharacterized protein n=1 Tax=Enterovirga rhinocerotis TaxID=1339210 RepID=A0A4R7C1P9_9HYPH|nr:hypothetical protein [Enterovirga rhinocerotis]TDR90316.1 hypothetical protein EV668_3164 [Enterovirga rhinocerotis]
MKTAVPERAVRPTAREKRDPAKPKAWKTTARRKHDEAVRLAGLYTAMAADLDVEARALAEAGQDNAKVVAALARTRKAAKKYLGQANALSAPADRADAEVAARLAALAPKPFQSAEAKRAEKRAQVRAEREQTAQRNRYKGLDYIQTDLRTAGGARTFDVLDNTRIQKGISTVRRKHHEMTHLPSQRSLWREKAAKAFDDLYHASRSEHGLKSPDIGMKVDHSASTGRAYDRAVSSMAYSKLERELPDCVVRLLEAVIIEDKRFDFIGREIGCTEGQAGRYFAAALDDVCDILGIKRPRKAKGKPVFYKGQRVKCVDPQAASATPPLVKGAFYSVVKVVDMPTRDGGCVQGLVLAGVELSPGIPGLLARRFVSRSIADVEHDERALGHYPTIR